MAFPFGMLECVETPNWHTHYSLVPTTYSSVKSCHAVSCVLDFAYFFSTAYIANYVLSIVLWTILCPQNIVRLWE